MFFFFTFTIKQVQLNYTSIKITKFYGLLVQSGLNNNLNLLHKLSLLDSFISIQ